MAPLSLFKASLALPLLLLALCCALLAQQHLAAAASARCRPTRPSRPSMPSRPRQIFTWQPYWPTKWPKYWPTFWPTLWPTLWPHLPPPPPDDTTKTTTTTERPPTPAHSVEGCGRVPVYEKHHGTSFHQNLMLKERSDSGYDDDDDLYMNMNPRRRRDGEGFFHSKNHYYDTDDESYDPDSTTVAHILHGMDAVQDEWPWIAHISLDGDNSGNCSASIISSRWLLTAGHCAESSNVSDYVATINLYNIEDAEDGIQLAVDKVVRHPNFSNKRGPPENDLALFRTATQIVWDYKTRPVCLIPPSEADALQWSRGKECFVVGYGVVEVEGMLEAKRLQKLRIEPLSPKECGAMPVQANAICAGSAAKNKLGTTCSGDSGGPLMCYDKEENRWQQFGVVSYGPSTSRELCAPERGGRWVVGVTDISKFRGWINETIRHEA